MREFALVLDSIGYRRAASQFAPLDEAIRQKSNDPRPYLERAWAFVNFGQSSRALADYDQAIRIDHLDVPEGRIWLKQSGVKHFAGDLSEAEQKLVYATQAAPVADLFNQKVEGTAWNAKPSWYVLATQDQTVPPDLQRFVSKRMRATTTEVASSHVPMLSKPDVVLDVIRKAAGAVSMS